MTEKNVVEERMEGSGKKPDRCDLKMFEGTLCVYFYYRVGRTDLLQGRPKETEEDRLSVEIAALREAGYTVREWPGGARAWKGEPWPIRSPAQIRRRRLDLEADARHGRLYDEDYNYLSLNLAFCL